MYIYEIVNTVNQKRYIGQTIRPPLYRWSTHKRALCLNKHYNVYLQCEWNEYKKDVFTFDVIHRCNTIQVLDETEKKIIAKYRSRNLCYNIADGGQPNHGKCHSKIWVGVKSPTGKIYRNIDNLSKFARQHQLDSKSLRRVASGERYSYKNWTTLVRKKSRPSDSHIRKLMSRGQKKSWLARKDNVVFAQGNPVKYSIWLKDPEGKLYYLDYNLSAFCRQQNIRCRGMNKMINGFRKTYKGWTTMENTV